MHRKNKASLLLAAIIMAIAVFFAIPAQSEPEEKPAAQDSAGAATDTSAAMDQAATGTQVSAGGTGEIERYEAECIGAEHKSKFVFQNRQYINKRFQDMAVNAWECGAYVSGNEEACKLNDVSSDENAQINTELENKCGIKFAYYTYLSRAALSPDKCMDNAMKFCVFTDFCPESQQCACDMVAAYICAISKVNSPDECEKLPGMFSPNIPLTPKERKGGIALCKNVLSGNYESSPKGNDTRYSNMIFLLGVFLGKNWPLLSKSVDLEELQIDPGFIWRYENIHLKKRECGEQLDSSWGMICKEYAQSKSMNANSVKTGENAPINTDSSKSAE